MEKNYKTIAVLMGGISSERNVSLVSGKAVVQALQNLGYTVKAIDPAKGKNGLLSNEEVLSAEAKPVDNDFLAQFSKRSYIECIQSSLFDDVDCCFLVLHGQYGEDGVLQTLLELRDIPYTGSKRLASAVAMDKALSKSLFQTAGIPTAPWHVLHKNDSIDLEITKEIREELGKDIVVKPNDQGSTVGMTFVRDGNLDSLVEAVEIASRYSDQILLETYVPGRELTVSMLGDEVLPIIEIEPKEGYYDYSNKYTKGKTEYHCPAELSDELNEYIANLAYAAFKVLGCEGFGRVDFRLSPDNIPFCLEVNTLPGFTTTSLLPMAAKEIDLSFEDLCQQLVDSI